MSEISTQKLETIKTFIVNSAKDMGFQDARICNTDTSPYFENFKHWVDNNYHGDMSFLERNQELRQHPEKLHPKTCRIISLRYDYLPENANFTKPLVNNQLANISRYALGRDYHKLMRKKLDRLAKKLIEYFDIALDYRVFVDSAPVLETCIAEKSGLGWKGKHSLVINESAGSWFFLGEIFINIPLPIDSPVKDLCGSCSACISICPTDAIIDGKTVDATKCISYLTIENKNAIPTELRKKIGNRIYGCDDCQLVCPWNRFSQVSNDESFKAKNQLDNISLLELWQWSETDFLNNFQGSPIRRIGYQSWLRNLAVAIGNSNYSIEIIESLKSKRNEANPMVTEHIDWAIENIENKKDTFKLPKKTQKLIRCIQAMHPRDA